MGRIHPLRGLLLCAAWWGGCHDGGRPPILPASDGGTRVDAADAPPEGDVTCGPDEAFVEAAPRDRWSPLVTFREATLVEHGRPSGGWYVTPLHGHLLPNGRVLLHGEMKDQNGTEAERRLVGNDIQWIVDPTQPEPAADVGVTVRPTLPWRQWVGNPNGTQTEPEGRHGAGLSTELLMCGGTTWLADGRLLYAGGTGVYTQEPSQAHPPEDDGVYEGGTWKTAFLDPHGEGDGGGAWRAGPPLLQGMRYYGTASRLADGDVLLVSGLYDTNRYDHTGIERLDVRANAWRSLVPSLPVQLDVPRDDPRAGLPPHKEDYPHVFVLPTPLPASHEAALGLPREVAVLGRRGDVSFVSVNAGEGVARIVRRPSWRRPDDPGAPTEERMHGASSALLQDGRIAVVAGSDSPGVAARLDVFDPRPGASFGTWRSTPLCAGPGRCHSRVHGAAVLAPDGEVLLLAGRSSAEGAPGDPRTPLLIDPATGVVREGTPWPEEDVRGYHVVAVPTLDGRVLVAGGRHYRWTRCDRYGVLYCEDERPDMRWYSPPWLDPSLARFRPTITDAPRELDGAATPRDLGLAVLTYRHDYALPVATDRPTGCAPALTAALMGLPSQTHSFDANQRHVPLVVTMSRDGLAIRTPDGPSAAPPGPYLLIVLRAVRVRADGSTVQVPSVARTVFLR